MAAKNSHDLHLAVNAKSNAGYSSVENPTASAVTVSKNGIVVFPRVVYEASSDRVIIGDGSGIAIADRQQWLNSLT